MSRASAKSPPTKPAQPAEPAQPPRRPPACCSFCGKTQNEVKRIIAGPSVYICDACVGVCATIIAREENKTASQLGVFNRNANEVEKCLLLLRELKSAGLIDEAEHKAKVRKLFADEPTPPSPFPPKKKRA